MNLIVEYNGETIQACSNEPVSSSDGIISLSKVDFQYILTIKSTDNYGDSPQNLPTPIKLRSSPPGVWRISPLGLDFMVVQNTRQVFNEVAFPGTLLRGAGFSDHSHGDEIFVLIDDNGIEFWTHIAIIYRSYVLEPIIDVSSIDDFIFSILGAPP